MSTAAASSCSPLNSAAVPAAAASAACGGVREADPSSVGMMEGAFFVSRSELLDWANRSLLLSLSRIEECASGCVYLQTLDCLLGPRSKVPMSRVKWGARLEYEFIHNYKLLQAAFDAHGIQKHIEVNKLVKAKYQDNLEFLQWLKAFCDRQAPVYATDVPYDPIERRKVTSAAAAATAAAVATVAAVAAASLVIAAAAPAAVVLAAAAVAATTAAASGGIAAAAVAAAAAGALGIGPFPSWAPVGPSMRPPPARKHAPAAAAAFAASSASNTRCRLQQQQHRGAPAAAAGCLLQRRQRTQEQQEEQQQQRGGAAAAAAAAAAAEQLQQELQQAIVERDFYYSKLRRLELLCGASDRQTLKTEEVLAILYAKEEEELSEGGSPQ
ncbi:hypothetical protein Efla_002650 [Eimeria flavescens]